MTYNPEAYWDERFSKAFDLETVGFDSFGRSFNRWQYRMKRIALERVIAENGLCSADKRVLDVGCGTGFHVGIWREKGIKDLMGIDIASLSIKKLAKHYPKYKFYKADIASPDLIGVKFDIITAFDVLFHIVDDTRFERAIKNIGNMCADGGIVLITDSFPHKHPYILKHQKSRALGEYERALAKYGLVVEKRIPVHFLLNAPLDVANEAVRRLLLLVWWKCFVGGLELVTRCMGALLYGLDLALTRIFRESPATEMMICKKG